MLHVGPKEDSREREHKRTQEIMITDVEVPTFQSRFLSGFPQVGGRMSKR